MTDESNEKQTEDVKSFKCLMADCDGDMEETGETRVNAQGATEKEFRCSVQPQHGYWAITKSDE